MKKLSETDYKELKRVVENAKFQEYEPLKYGGINILFFPCKQTRVEQQRGVPPIFFKISDVVDYDIYFSMNLVPVDFRKPCLLHEVLEIRVVEELKLKSEITNEEMWKLAHRVARKYDLIYAKEKLSKERYEEYRNLQRMLRRTDLPGLIN